MPKNIHVLVSDDEHERLKELKDEHDLTWLELIEHGADRLEPDAPEQ